MGTGFWVKWALVAVGAGLAAMILFFILGAAWAAWGALGAFVFIGAVLLLIGWIYDRRHPERSESYD